ncbi:MAG: ribbon-helix-helix domain-containing protein, partial [Brachymonas sp.]|nr:ribbon-helix-helix domain-containing protein [Brachymonas sp.]
MNTLTVKIPFELEQAVDTLAARTHQTRSEVVRQALHAFVQQEQQPGGKGLLDAVPDLVGCFAGGPADLSANPTHLA